MFTYAYICIMLVSICYTGRTGNIFYLIFLKVKELSLVYKTDPVASNSNISIVEKRIEGEKLQNGTVGLC